MRNTHPSRSLLGFVIFLLSISLGHQIAEAQSSLSSIKSQAELLVRQKKYSEASQLYQQYIDRNPQDWKVQLEMVKVEFELEQYSSAAGRLNYIRSLQKKEQPDIVLLQAKIFHADQQYKEAAAAYKHFLRIAKSKDLRRNAVSNEVLRCYQGMQLQYAEKIAVVENLGEFINFEGDDRRPIVSPNNSDKIYFSSNRPLKNSKNAFMMLSSAIDRGSFKSSAYLPEHLNTEENEILQDFNFDGSVMLFLRGISDKYGKMMTDTFKESSAQDKTVDFWHDSPAITERGDKDIQLFNDSILVFSSRRTGGYGGFDLYVSEKRREAWTKPKNLGPKINTAFDEVSPYLCRDGRTIYFSSNSGKSIGGFDVFKSIYSDRDTSWSDPINLAPPVNSPMDDFDFRISPEGTKAYLSSNRKGGFGGQDIYIGHLRNREEAQFNASFPIVFSQVPAYREQLAQNQREKEKTEPSVKPDNSGSAGKMSLTIEPLFIRDADLGISSAHQVKLNEIAAALTRFPKLQVEIRGHVFDSGTKTFLLYNSLQEANKYGDYLVSRGVSKEKMILKGLGNQYPIALVNLDGRPNPSALFLNQRIEIVIHGEDPDLDLKYDFPEVSQSMRDNIGYDYIKKLRGVTYKVQFASLRQMYAGDQMEKYTDGSIEWRGTNQFMQYSIGLVKRTSEAINIRTQARNDGFNDAFIVPYLDGIRLQRGDIVPELLEKYPDLKNYIRLTD
jgi:outer membrane protein OmpA-like peptidoglycan-associated protein/tetratricopeptide (TPR) repeat protein